ncbi:unnamed protein product [Rotaria magnacalcarata]|uniref:Cadherin domain-containing protein n=2 Tax=Rotaria magnacalcarata TaxID=392030 RepID=A0A817A0A3_9BILA|nr:unnamed protein product [Rotaria magnacalcarata]CAF3734571.1 unnamed protein product [Rotaria magnacalcarata]
MLIILIFLPFVATSDYSIKIDEKSSINKTIYQFPRSYELLNNFQSSFNLTNDNKNLILTKNIDRDYWCLQNICSCDYCSFILELFSNDDKISPTFSTINVTITDINDHACQFLDIQKNIFLSESIQIGHRFPIARAIDYDSGINSQLSFKLIDNNDYFELNIIKLSTNEYALYGIVKHSFDRELNEKYDLTIEAHDHGISQVRFNRTKVTLWILDENDNAPKFNQTEYSIQSLPEDTPMGTELLTITATDVDKGLNGLIHYSIIIASDISLFPFVINATTGVISLRLSLDYETIRSYRFLIRASDSGLPQSLYTDTWLSIKIKDINDCPVEIFFLSNRQFQYDNQILSIHENTEINNLTLGYIRLYDRDSEQTKISLSLVMLDKNVKQDYEVILSNQINSYKLNVKQGIFDRELQTEINLRFIATDTLLTSIYDLKIHLIDLNDNPSEFSSNLLKFSVEELANYHMVDNLIENYQLTIGYLNAFDRDEGENALNKYEIELNSLVEIDPDTGRLFLIQPIDREQISIIELKAKAINIVEPKWETEVQIQIHILDVNDNIPHCSASYQRISIPENFPIDQPLIKINATDADYDINGTIHCSLRINSSWPFEINYKTGEIYSEQIFDYELETKIFKIIIDLEDEGFPRKNQNINACQLEINIEDINDNRPELFDETQTQIFVDLQNPFNAEIVLLNVTDLDSGDNGKIKYTLLTHENDSHFIIYQNGSLQMIHQINQIAMFELKILLEDYGIPSQQTIIIVSVAIGDSSIPSYSTFEKVQLKYSRPRSLGLIVGLSVLIVTFGLFLCIIITSVLLRKHRRQHQAAIIARKKLLCSSSQQLTSSGSTETTTTTSLSIEHQHVANILQIKPTYWHEKYYDQHSSNSYNVDTSSSESRTYKILHIPQDSEYYMQYYQQEKLVNHGSDHGYHGSNETGSSSSPASQVSVRRLYMVNQLPDFVTRCKSVNGGFLIEMNVDGSDEDAR